MKIALIQCPCASVEIPSLGIAYLCSALKKNSHQVRVFDFNIDSYCQNNGQDVKRWCYTSDQFWSAENEFLNKLFADKWFDKSAASVLEFNPDVVGFSVQATSFFISLKVAEKIKVADDSRKIVFGGPECSREDPRVLLTNKAIDFVVTGEGEIAIVELLECLQGRKKIIDCLGVAFKTEDNKIICNPPREVNHDISALNFPDFSEFELKKYLCKFTLPMLTSRGCIKRCAYCVDTWYQEQYRYRNPENIVQEIIYLINSYDVRAIRFNDLLINGNLEALDKLCDDMIKKNITHIPWSSNAVPRKMSVRLLSKMYKAGCRSLTFGAESFSQRVLNLMQKNVRVNDVEDVIKNTAKTGIMVTVNWLLGFPGEEREDVKNTMVAILRNRKHITASGGVNILAINAPSTISKKADKLQIILNQKDNFAWRYKNNDLLERKHRQKVFTKFLKKIGLYSENVGIAGDESQHHNLQDIPFIRRRKIISESIRNLYAKAEN